VHWHLQTDLRRAITAFIHRDEAFLFEQGLPISAGFFVQEDRIPIGHEVSLQAISKTNSRAGFWPRTISAQSTGETPVASSSHF
jgi:hypothetical protein